MLLAGLIALPLAGAAPGDLSTSPKIAEIQSLVDRGDYRAALDAANRVIASSPRESEAYRMRANARRNLGDLPGALEDANKAVELDPSNVRALGGRSIVKRLLKDTSGALADLERALKLNPSYHQGYESRSLLRLESGELAGALADANRAIELSPKTASYYVRRASIRKALKEPAAAMADLARSIEIDSNEPSAYSQRALMLADSGNQAGALEDLSRAIKLAPNNATYLQRRAALRRGLKDLAGADQDLTKAIELAPADPKSYFQRGLVRIDQKRWDEAIADNTKAIDLKLPNAAAAYNNRGLAYKNRGMLSEARRDYDQALRIQPSDRSASNNLARLDNLPAAASARDIATPDPKTPTVPGTAVPIPSLPKPAEDTLWTTPAGPEYAIPTDAPPLALGSAPDPVATAEGLESGATALAMEGLRHLAGPLSPADERKFNQKWQPFFDFPTAESDAYFKKLGPELTELAAVKGVVARSAASFDYAWTEAVVSCAAGDKVGAAESLEVASHHARRLQSANARLNRLAANVQRLGNPPNPVEAKKKASNRFLKYFLSDQIPHLAYLWRIVQCDADNNEKLQSHLARHAYGKKDSVLAPYVWPVDEPAWVSWFNAGGNGPEPLGAKKPANEVMHAALQLRTTNWFVTPSPYAYQPGEKLLTSYVTPREAAQAISAGRKVVTYGRFANAAAAAAAAAPAPAAAPNRPPAVAGAEATKRAEEEAKARAEAIAEHRSWIEISKRNLAFNQAAYEREKDPAAKAEWLRRILNDKAEISSRNDQIHTLKTGEVIHTRTEADQYCHDLMVHRAQEQMAAAEQKIANIQATAKVAGFLAYQAYTAPEEQKKQIADFVARNLTPEDLANGNLAKAKQVAAATFETVQGLHGQKAAAAELESIDKDEYFVGAERMQTAAAVSGMLVSVGAPMYWAAAGVAGSGSTLTAIGAGAGLVSGSIQGGPVEGVKQAVAQTGLPGMIAAEMMTGYQRGGLVSEGGLVGALERGAEAFLLGKAIEAGASRAGAWLMGAPKGGTPVAVATASKPMTVEELIESESFRMMKRTAEEKIGQYRAIKNQIIKARQAGASAAELATLEAERLKLAAKMNEDLLAKRILKGAGAEGRKPNGNPADVALESDFADAQDILYKTQVDPAFRNNVKQAGYHWRKKAPGGKWETAGDLEFKDFRHKSSTDVKTVNTDRDCGLIEQKNRPGEVWQLYRGDEPTTLANATDDLQAIYEQSYHQATGGNAKAAMQQITSGASGDAYKSVGYLKMGGDPKNALAVDKAWVEQATEVSRHKITLPPGDPLANNLTAKIDHANQIAKDVKERLLPFLKASKAPPEDIKLFTDVQNALATMERDPVGATRQLKTLTGLDTVAEVSDKISNRFVGAVKLSAAGR